MGTQTKLIEDLLKKPETKVRDAILQYAKVGGYHDFKSDIAMPKRLLVEHLIKAGYTDLATNTKRGDYDDKFEKPQPTTGLDTQKSNVKSIGTAKQQVEDLPPSDQKLLDAMDEIRAVCKRYDVGMLVNIHSKTHAEYGIEFPSWSRARFIERSDGAMMLHIKMKSNDGRQEDNDATVGMILGMRDVCIHQAAEMEKLYRKLTKNMKVDHAGKFNHHDSVDVTEGTDDQPGPSESS